MAALAAGCSSDGALSSENAAGAGGSGNAPGSGGSGAVGGSGNAPGAGSSGAGGAGASFGNGESASWVGNFQLTIADADPEGVTPAYSGVLGIVYDLPQPTDGPKFEPAEEDGDCRLLVPVNPFCEPTCSVDAVCTADGVCTPYSKAQNLGVVRMTGLSTGEFAMDPIAPSYKYQPPGSVHLPYPPCAEGDPVGVIAASPGLAIETACVAPIVLSGTGAIAVRSEQPVRLEWEPPTTTGTRVGIDLDIAHHGGATGKIVCDVEDDGAFDIPEGLVTRLVALGLAGYPAITLTRTASTTAPSAPRVALTISATTSRLVDTGVVSCGVNMPCPADLTCKTDHSCQ